MSEQTPIRPGQILVGILFNQPMRVETVHANGANSWSVGLVGTHTGQFRRVVLTDDAIKKISIIDGSNHSYDGDGHVLRLGLKACALGIAHEFDPYFGLSISRVDPLPHQLEAVYEHMLKLSTVRFLLADDAGAGKTIMAGLLVRELRLRGLAERILIVCPANLTFQWQRELSEKFDEKFLVLKGGDIRDQFGVNQWLEQQRIITSLDLAKRTDILPGLQQVHWDLVIVDEAHRMSWSPPARKTARYSLGELLRDSTDHILLLTATPHKGDPENFARFLQLIDRDAYADVKSIHEAINHRRAPFYLRRTKEAMFYFPERQTDGEWKARPVFTKRIPRTVGFMIDEDEWELYLEITRFVKRQSANAAAQRDDPRARAVGFLMVLYQRRLASSVFAMRHSLENRAKRLEKRLQRAQFVAKNAPPSLPDPEEIDEMEDDERERFEELLDAVTLADNAEQVRDEILELRQFADRAKAIENSGKEAKLTKLKDILQSEGFFDLPGQRLLLFTEFKDTLNCLVDHLKTWGFTVGYIHGGMKPGSRDEPGTRLHAEQQFREGKTQVLVATEAAGEGINLQCCHILFNYDIPWNPNRLEQRMGRIHRYGQNHDCLIFNFVATNTIEGRVLKRLMDKLQEIRDALDDDVVFNVIGEILPATQIERVLRDYYAGRLDEANLENHMLEGVDEDRFRAICQTALEGLASKKLNLEMLIERRAKAREQRVVPESIARFMVDCAKDASLALKSVPKLAHTFDPGRTPPVLKKHERGADWKLPQIAARYPRLSTDRETADQNHLEWITPGHPLFEALRLHALETAKNVFTQGACFHSLAHEAPTRLDVYRAKVVDGLGHTVHERLFAVELREDGEPQRREPGLLSDLTPAAPPDNIPSVAHLPEATDWLMETMLEPFLEKVQSERSAEIERITKHVELSLTEVLQRIDVEIGHAAEEAKKGSAGAKGRLTQAEARHGEVLERRNRRNEELEREQNVTLQEVERLTSLLILPHPERSAPEVKRLRPNPETEMKAMRVVMDHENARGCQVYDVHEKNLGYDVTSLDLQSGELRLIEVKGLAATTGNILLTPNEFRVAEDRRDCYWLYIVTGCASALKLKLIKNPARLQWRDITKVQHYWLAVDTLHATGSDQ